MTNSIPASQIVQIVPEVLAAGGSALVMNGAMLSASTRVPLGTFLSFPTATAVGNYFGPTSTEAVDANVYFAGFTNSQKLPGALLITQYPQTSVGAYLRGGNISSLSLTQLQALSGVLTVTIDGTPHTSSAINLSSATSFSAASELITTALGQTGPTQAVVTASVGATFTGTATGTSMVATSVTGVIHVGDVITGTGVSGTVSIVSQSSGSTGAAGTYITSASTTASSATISCASTTIDITAVSSGTIQIGQQVTGVGVASGTFITAFLTGSGGVGTYTLTLSQSPIGSESVTMIMPTVTYDSISGAFTVVSGTTGAASTITVGSGTIAASLLLTAATGAVLSQGSVAATPGPFMTAFAKLTQNWVTFWTAFDPDTIGSTGNAQKLLFAAWVNQPFQGMTNRFIYAVDDMDITPTQSTVAASSLGYILDNTASTGTIPIYEPSGLHLSSFVAGFIASVDFNQTNGRATMAFKGQSGLGISVTDATVAANLIANGYNFYGAYATANQQFMFMNPGSITGEFDWVDSYYGQVYLNNALQLAIMQLLVTVNTIPYAQKGYALIRAACLDPINAAINFGTIVPGVTLSAQQAQVINFDAGANIAPIIQNVGYYLQVLNATPQTRQARQSPPINFWYTDGEAIQQIILSSILVQ